MSKRLQIKLTQLGAITIAWIAFGFIMTIYDHLVLSTHHSKGVSDTYSFGMMLTYNCGSALVGALLGGSFLVFYIHDKFFNRSYRYILTAIVVSYVTIILMIVVILSFISVPLQTGKALTDPESLEALKLFLTDTSRIKNVMTWFFVVACTQIVLQVISKFGYRNFGEIISGKYHTPKEEKRIFMFLDLNSSTSIAESLGNEKYHQFIRDFFADITNPILNNQGSIYQYVGDEVVIQWQYKEGMAGENCIQCFYDIKACIESNSRKYLQRYGYVPSFKAGIHSGTVIAGEIGIMKRDLTYSGDVLNTASRIQGMCREFQAELIASSDLLRDINLSTKYTAETLGVMKLRGKEREVTLNTLKPIAA